LLPPGGRGAAEADREEGGVVDSWSFHSRASLRPITPIAIRERPTANSVTSEAPWRMEEKRADWEGGEGVRRGVSEARVMERGRLSCWSRIICFQQIGYISIIRTTTFSPSPPPSLLSPHLTNRVLKSVRRPPDDHRRYPVSHPPNCSYPDGLVPPLSHYSWQQ